MYDGGKAEKCDHKLYCSETTKILTNIHYTTLNEQKLNFI